MVAADTPAVADDLDDAPEPAEQPPGDQPEEPSGRRAQRLRAQEAVARAEAAEGRLASMQRREVERLAGATLAQGRDVLDAALGGVDLDDLLDDDGVLDDALVHEAAAAVVAARPGLGVPAPRHTGREFDGGVRQAPPRARGWASLFRGDDR